MVGRRIVTVASLFIVMAVLNMPVGSAAAAPSAIRVSIASVEVDSFVAAISGDGTIATLASDDQVSVWNARSGQVLRVLGDSSTKAVISAALNFDGSQAATFTSDKKLAVWDTVSGEKLYAFQMPPAAQLWTTIGFIRDSDYISVLYRYSSETRVLVIDIKRAKTVFDHTYTREEFDGIYSLDGAVLITGPYGAVRVSTVDFSATYVSTPTAKSKGLTQAGISIDQKSAEFAKLVSNGTSDKLSLYKYDFKSNKFSSDGEFGISGDFRNVFISTLGSSGADLILGKVDRVQIVGGSAFFSLLEDAGKRVVVVGKLSDKAITKTDIQPIFSHGDLPNQLIYAVSADGESAIADETVDVIERFFQPAGAQRIAETLDLSKFAEIQFAIPPVLAKGSFTGGDDGVLVHAASVDGANVNEISDAVVSAADGTLLAWCSLKGPTIDPRQVLLPLVSAGGHYAHPYPPDNAHQPDCSKSNAAVTSIWNASSILDKNTVLSAGSLPDAGFVVLPPSGSTATSQGVGFSGFLFLPNRAPLYVSIPPQSDEQIKVPQQVAPISLDGDAPFGESVKADRSGDRVVEYDPSGFVSVIDLKAGVLSRPGRCSLSAAQAAFDALGVNAGAAPIVDGQFRQAVATLTNKSDSLVDEAKLDLAALNLSDGRMLRMACGLLGLNAAPVGEELKDATLSDDGTELATTSSSEIGSRDTVALWDATTGAMTSEIGGNGVNQGPALAAVFDHPGKKLILARAPDNFQVYDLAAKTVTTSFAGEDGAFSSMRLDDKGHLMVLSADGTVRTYDLDAGQILTTLAATPSGGRVVMTRDGFYDATGDGANLVRVISGRNVTTLGALEPILFRPDLVHALAAGDPDGLYAAAAKQTNLAAIVADGFAPAVKIASLEQDATVPAGGKISIMLTVGSGGPGKVVVRNGGTTVGVFDAPATAKDGDSVTLSEAIPVVNGGNSISVVAYNRLGTVGSEPAQASLNAEVKEAPPTLYVIAVGVDDYADSRLKLKFSVPDARAVGDILADAGKSLFAGVVERRVLDADATATGIAAAFGELAQVVKPNDVFVLYFAGHGITQNGSYYFLPQNFVYQSPASIESEGIDQGQIQKWMASISAQKSILLFDTCESGTVAELAFATRGIAEETAIDKLNHAIGRSVISASSDTEPALEGYRGHGVFTYAFLEAIANGDANGDGVVDLTELFQYIDTQVPDISKTAFGLTQTPQVALEGTNFAVANPTVAAALNQGGTFIPKRSTHVTVVDTTLFSDEDMTKPIGEKLHAGVLVTQTRTVGAASEVAQDGQIIGFVATSSLVQLQ